MSLPARTLRATLDEQHPQPLTYRQQEREARILADATCILARHGTGNVGFSELSVALRMAPKTLRDHFADVPALLARILHNHLLRLFQAVIAIPPDQPARRRAAYLRATREALGGLTQSHTLLVRDRHHLPDDERQPIEQTRFRLGQTIAGDLAHQALHLLDCDYTEIELIEPMIAALEAAAEARKQPRAAATFAAPPETVLPAATAPESPAAAPPPPEPAAPPPESDPARGRPPLLRATPPSSSGLSRSIAAMQRLAAQLERQQAHARSPPQGRPA